MKKNLVILIVATLTFITITFIASIFVINSNKYLKSFSLISVNNISNKYQIKFEKVKAAKSYDIIIYNDYQMVFYKKTVYKTTNNITLTGIEYNHKYKLVVFAYDSLGDSISVKNPYTFTYTEPTFSENNNLIFTNNQDYILLIDGDLSKKNYDIRLYEDHTLIKSDQLKTNKYIIDKSIFSNLQKKITAKIFYEDNIVNTIDLYSNVSPLSDLKIVSPTEGVVLDYNDVTFTYEGGSNATKYLLQIYKDHTLIKEKEITKNRCVISSEFFVKAQNYKIVIKALYKDYSDYTKSAEVNFSMNEKDTLKPAFINHYYKYVSSGTSLELFNPNNDGNIYYTVDGTDPNTNGLEYTSPIIANQNMTIKAVIKEPKKNNSITSEFKVNIGKKDIYKVYLSPSNQTANIGVASVGYTNEGDEMNDLANYIEKELKKYNVKVYRNNPNGNINIWDSDSKYYGCDIHLAIHSNASDDGTGYGIETWINEQTSESYSLANLIQSSLMHIYYKADGDGNRGVKYANGALGEVNDNYVPFGMLVEVAYHDYKDDAEWILVNKKLIGNTIADAVLKYFGII